MVNEKIFVVLYSTKSGDTGTGTGISLSGDKRVKFDGYEATRSIFSYDFRSPDFAVKRKKLENYFLGKLSGTSIYFDDYDAMVKLEEEEEEEENENENLPEDQSVSFSVVLKGSRVYAANVKAI